MYLALWSANVVNLHLHARNNANMEWFQTQFLFRPPGRDVSNLVERGGAAAARLEELSAAFHRMVVTPATTASGRVRTG